MSRAALLYGDEALLNDYKERVDRKLNAALSEGEAKCTRKVGVNRGMQQMIADIKTYDPFNSYLGVHSAAGAYFDAKKDFYRLISLLLSDLGMIFDIKCPSPWQIISELFVRGIISESQSAEMRNCLSFANEIRLKTYFANNGQKELISPLSQYANPTQQSVDAAVFQDVDQDVVVGFLRTSFNFQRQCEEFHTRCISQNSIDGVIPNSFSSSGLPGILYYRMQNIDEALKWVKSEPHCGPFDVECLIIEGNIYILLGKYDQCIKLFEDMLLRNDLNADVFKIYSRLAVALLHVGNYQEAIQKLREAIEKHRKLFGEKTQSIVLMNLLAILGQTYYGHADMNLAVDTLKEAQEMQVALTNSNVPDCLVASLNSDMAAALCQLDRYAESVECMEKSLQLSHKIFGEDNPSIHLAETYNVAGNVYHRSKLEDKTVSFFERSLLLYRRIFGNDPNLGKGTTYDQLEQFLRKNKILAVIERNGKQLQISWQSIPLAVVTQRNKTSLFVGLAPCSYEVKLHSCRAVHFVTEHFDVCKYVRLPCVFHMSIDLSLQVILTRMLLAS
jgi:tetratricopeptide (TPR) repeat protein